MKKIKKIYLGFRNFWKIFKQNKLGVVGLVIFLIFTFLAIFAPQIAFYPPLTTGVGDQFLNPSLKYPLGTDNLGRDLFTELLSLIRDRYMKYMLGMCFKVSYGVS